MNDDYQCRKETFLLSTDPKQLDIDAVYHFLTLCYWAKGISKETVIRSIANCIPFGIYEHGKQIAFARVITDRATYAYISDVFVMESHRGQDVATWLIECIMKHPDLGGLRRWNLYTSHAPDFYKRFGFTQLKHPECYMEIYDPNIYQKSLTPP